MSPGQLKKLYATLCAYKKYKLNPHKTRGPLLGFKQTELSAKIRTSQTSNKSILSRRTFLNGM